jgi:hypothetical protein
MNLLKSNSFPKLFLPLKIVCTSRGFVGIVKILTTMGDRERQVYAASAAARKEVMGAKEVRAAKGNSMSGQKTIILPRCSEELAMRWHLKCLQRNLPKPHKLLKSVNVHFASNPAVFSEHSRWSEVSKKVRPHGFKLEREYA